MARRTPSEQIEAEARAWLLQLRAEDPCHQDIVAWQAWLQADPKHLAAYDEATAVWEMACQVPMAPTAEAELVSDRYDGAVPVRHWRGRRARPIWLAAGVVAASIVLLVGVMGARAFLAPDPPARQVATGRGQRELVVLPDGSKMMLGGMTAVEIRYTRRERQLVLARGQATFQVAHDEPQPFIVKTQLGDVKAIGTAFDINVRSRSMILTVTEGVVQVDALPREGRTVGFGLQPLRVSAGQTLTVGQNGVRLEMDLPFGGGWTKGWLAYRNEPLAAVVEDLNRYAETPIRLRDVSLGELAYTGTVQLSNAAAWVAALPDGFPIEVRRTADEIILEKKAGQRLPERRSPTS